MQSKKHAYNLFGRVMRKQIELHSRTISLKMETSQENEENVRYISECRCPSGPCPGGRPCKEKLRALEVINIFEWEENDNTKGIKKLKAALLTANFRCALANIPSADKFFSVLFGCLSRNGYGMTPSGFGIQEIALETLHKKCNRKLFQELGQEIDNFEKKCDHPDEYRCTLAMLRSFQSTFLWELQQHAAGLGGYGEHSMETFSEGVKESILGLKLREIEESEMEALELHVSKASKHIKCRCGVMLPSLLGKGNNCDHFFILLQKWKLEENDGDEKVIAASWRRYCLDLV